MRDGTGCLHREHVRGTGYGVFVSHGHCIRSRFLKHSDRQIEVHKVYQDLDQRPLNTIKYFTDRECFIPFFNVRLWHEFN